MVVFKEKVAQYLDQGIPFLFLLDFLKERQLAYTFEEAAKANIFFNIKGETNYVHKKEGALDTGPVVLQYIPLDKTVYAKAFNTVKKELALGNSFLLNLTFATELTNCPPLKTVFRQAQAPYKLLYKDRFTVFSPESYLRITGGHVYSFPMKGTIKTSVPHAERVLLENRKETYEHNTIVDLIRNDLSMISKEVTVTKFRYLEEIKTRSGNLLQTSSEIRGKLPTDWKDRFAELLLSTLPAGSISGAPKEKTLKIINAAETAPRGFYTGVFGIFNGTDIDAAVSIRYIEHRQGKYYFRSGGGITHLSSLADEYQELHEKIYIPFV